MIIKYHITKEDPTPEVKANVDSQGTSEESGDNLEKQNVNDIQEDEEEIPIPLTPEMEHANTIYHQAMKLINGTINRQYET